MALLSHGATLIMVATAKMWKKHSRVACNTLTPLELLSLQWRPMALLSHGGDANDGGNSKNEKEALTSGVKHFPRLHIIPYVLCSIRNPFWSIFSPNLDPLEPQKYWFSFGFSMIFENSHVEVEIDFWSHFGSNLAPFWVPKSTKIR